MQVSYLQNQLKTASSAPPRLVVSGWPPPLRASSLSHPAPAEGVSAARPEPPAFAASGPAAAGEALSAPVGAALRGSPEG